ncbi:glycoside hydrolase family 3 C-terminal domain-containing protein [Plebeiibacterium sediminum]|uniref:Glycoside hydrolase family 3 C-terminal domain-containing protein n=1 Tax=Plebeiibacterium sediminum TaxID=2992112 RepID=A0AAE3SFB4_9BACT|nr:glycoside hydrolase family 3 C-terminal domain-containing protein [Plebeiobacterium sediminum]MCW3787320.1 glycoside hydrolase family 3 C-terminal domain-containing protein [Plebeiobacterium sediminum]
MKNLFKILILLMNVFLIHSLNAQKLSSDNIDEILKAMTLEEKAKLLVGTPNHLFGGGESTVGHTEELVPGAAGTTQNIERLGITSTVLSDGPAGLRISPTRPGDDDTYYCTGFPVGTCLSSSWNTELVYEVGKTIGNEVLEYGADVLLAPGMNIHRNPLCGRNFEYYSEDPLLTGKIAEAYVNGVQSNGVGTSVKHYVANNQETNRTGNDSQVSQRALREIYLKGFEIAIKESKPWTVMSSYNKLNGDFTQESHGLLTTVLREEWGFDGIVMTDWTRPRNIVAQIKAGNDLMEPGMQVQAEEIVAKVNSGELTMEDVDKCVKRMLEFVVKTPRFKGYKYSNKPNLKENAKVTRQSATEGMVLLKNINKTLPLAEQTKNIALFGVTSYDFIAGGTGSGDVNKAYVVDLMEGLGNVGYTVQEDLKALYEKYKAYERAKIASETEARSWFLGKPVLKEMPVARLFIQKQAEESDVAVITIGRNSGEGGDRKIPNDYGITTEERKLLNDVCDVFHSKGKKVVVILNIGGVLETASWKNLPDAILLTWQPGQEGGNSVADVLKGTVNPSGKLPMTFPIAVMDHPSTNNFPYDYTPKPYNSFFGNSPEGKDVDYTVYEEDIYVGYRYFSTVNKPISYPFGFGLSYTDFEYGKPKISAKGSEFTATISVKNIGQKAGKQVVELYVTAPDGKLEKPAKELKAFAKTKELAPGESQILTLKFSAYDLASYDEAIHSWVTDGGKYTAKFGTSVEDIFSKVLFNVSKASYEVNDVLKPEVDINRLSLKQYSHDK